MLNGMEAETHKLFPQVLSLQTQLTDCVTQILKQPSSSSEPDVATSTSVTVAPPMRHGRASQRRSALFSVAHQSQATSDSLRTPLVEFFNTLEAFYKSLQSLPFNEIVSFNDFEIIASHFAFDFSSLLHATLNHSTLHFPPHFTPQLIRDVDNRLNQLVEPVSSTHNDIAIVHSLLSEHGKYVNIFDWFQSFVAMVSPSNSSTVLLTALPPVELHSYYARFHLAMNAMQLMGFITETQRKADHVQRTTFYANE
jgi:hypothetical protein